MYIVRLSFAKFACWSGSRRALPMILIALSLGACSSSDSDPPSVLVEAAHREDEWRGHDIDGYTYEYFQACFCPPTNALATVAQNVVVSAIDLDTQEPFEEQRLATIRTVEDCFEFIQSAAAAGAEVVNVTYDEPLSYPSEIYVDYSFGVADDEMSITVRNLTETGSRNETPTESAQDGQP